MFKRQVVGTYWLQSYH